MDFSRIIQKVNSDKRLVPDLLKAENGNNFRAVSESAILDVINPILEEECIFYTVNVKEQKLDIREAFGSKGKKLQFIATLTVSLIFYEHDTVHDCKEVLAVTEAVGMGIDDNDKAMGKAYTYAVKYALLKLFRLRFGDDSDFKSSEPLYLDKPKETKKEEPKEEKKKSSKNKKTKEEPAMTEGQRDYILGLMDKKGIAESSIISKFGVEPTRDEYISMKVARAIISWLQEQEDLPF